jgi:malonate transporter and related proteins
LTVFASILPVFSIILLGVAIRWFRWLPEAFFPSIEKFSYYIAFPALLFAATARLRFSGDQVGELALATLLPTLIIVGVTLTVLLVLQDLPAASRSSVLQGAVRPNSYFGIAVSTLLFDAKTASMVMLSLALCLPVVNFIAIVALSWWSGGKTDLAQLAKTLAKNPIILSTLAGLLVSVSGLPLPAPLMTTMDILGKAALALGLICVGGGLVFSTVGLRPMALTLSSALKLLALPLVAAEVCLIFGISTGAAVAACFYCALPTAPNAYIMSKQMGGDSRLMASLITVQTLAAPLTVAVSTNYLAWLAA